MWRADLPLARGVRGWRRAPDQWPTPRASPRDSESGGIGMLSIALLSPKGPAVPAPLRDFQALTALCAPDAADASQPRSRRNTASRNTDRRGHPRDSAGSRGRHRRHHGNHANGTAQLLAGGPVSRARHYRRTRRPACDAGSGGCCASRGRDRGRLCGRELAATVAGSPSAVA